MRRWLQRGWRLTDFYSTLLKGSDRQEKLRDTCQVSLGTRHCDFTHTLSSSPRHGPRRSSVTAELTMVQRSEVTLLVPREGWWNRDLNPAHLILKATSGLLTRGWGRELPSLGGFEFRIQRDRLWLLEAGHAGVVGSQESLDAEGQCAETWATPARGRQTWLASRWQHHSLSMLCALAAGWGGG